VTLAYGSAWAKVRLLVTAQGGGRAKKGRPGRSGGGCGADRARQNRRPGRGRRAAAVGACAHVRVAGGHAGATGPGVPLLRRVGRDAASDPSGDPVKKYSGPHALGRLWGCLTLARIAGYLDLDSSFAAKQSLAEEFETRRPAPTPQLLVRHRTPVSPQAGWRCRPPGCHTPGRRGWSGGACRPPSCPSPPGPTP
jgi:hypothetical protein